MKLPKDKEKAKLVRKKRRQNAKFNPKKRQWFCIHCNKEVNKQVFIGLDDLYCHKECEFPLNVKLKK